MFEVFKLRKTIKIDLLTSTIFVLVLSFYVTASILSLPVIPTLGKYMFIALMAMIFIMLVQRRFITSKEFILFLPFILFTVVYLVNLNGLSDTRGMMTVLNQLAYLMVMYLVYSITWTKFQIKSLSTVYYIALPILLIFLFVLPGLLNTNTIGSFAYFLTFFPLLFLVGYTKKLKRSRIMLIFALTALVILATDARSILLSAAVGLVTYVLWKGITKSKFLFNLYFFLIVAINYFIIVIYPNLYKWEHFYTFNDWSLRFTGKPIMTGRNTIWAQLLDLISLKPWLGHGSGVLPEDFLSTSLSAHNLYLQIGLQTGIIGISLLVLFFFVVWRMLWKNKTDLRVKLVGAFLISIMIHQTFEVTLTQNQFSIGLLQWLIIGFGLNFALNKNKTIKTEPTI